MSIAMVFPGQGAQTIGMGKDLADAYPEARAVFEEVDEVLGEALSALIWDGDAEELTLTQNAQPALMATSIAAIRAMEAEGLGLDKASFVAGHSLGEYSALCAAGALSLADTARLLRIRGQAMQEAVPVGVGAMAAILGLERADVDVICTEAAGDQVCQAANINDPSQIVISGHKEAVERAAGLAKDKGAKRALMLPVSAPFHCSLMQPAADRMAEALADTEISAPKVPLVANVTASAVKDPDEIRARLIEQVTGSVRWLESVQYLVSEKMDTFWEIGAGKALSGMIKRINREMTIANVGTSADLAQLKEG
ncbi:MAG: ACP S-malonyltransferase [Pseudomonadota bacterium]